MKALFDKFSDYVDTEYSIELTKKLASFEFRIAGTEMQRAAADWIVEEMKKINLQNVTKESFPIDSWGFKSATVDILGAEPVRCEGSTMVPLNGTDADGVTAEVVYVGDGTKAWYDKVDVTGKIVFMDTNMFGDYWVNVLYHQAQLKGAVGIISAPVGIGPGTATDDICTIQTYMGTPIDIPAVMVTITDSNKIREMLEAGKSVTANLKVDIDMVYGADADYIYGLIPGKNPDKYLIIGGHFDAYYEGFNDNATSFGTQMAIAKAVIDSGYQPECTWVIITNGSEETGCQGTRADWLHGIMWALKNHPEWIGNTMALENIECTGLMETTDYHICTENTFRDVTAKIFEDIKLPEETPDGLVIEHIGTGADHILTSIEGIPSFMIKNTPTVLSEVKGRVAWMNYYHTAIDDYDHANLKAMNDHNRIYGQVCLAFDKMVVIPMQFNGHLDFFWEGTDENELQELYLEYDDLKVVLDEYRKTADYVYSMAEQINEQKMKLHAADSNTRKIYDRGWAESKKMLAANKIIQDETHIFDNWTIAAMAHKQPYSYVTTIDAAIQELSEGKAGESCEAMKYLHTNYLYVFDKEAYDLYAIDIYDEEKYPQYWYTGRSLKYPDMWEVLNSIERKNEEGINDFDEEIQILKGIRDDQYEVLLGTLEKEKKAFGKAADILKTVELTDIFDAINAF